MDFAHRLAAAGKHKGLTQQALADHVGIHVTQIRRYEAGTSQPILDVLRKLAVTLGVTTDTLVFEESERGPADTRFAIHFEALDRLDDERTPSSTSSNPSCSATQHDDSPAPADRRG